MGDFAFAARCSMRLRVRHLCIALIPVAVLLAFAMGDDTDRHYCTSCGRIRLSEFRTCLGFTGPRSTRYHKTEFHRILLSTGHIECEHRWQAFFWNHHNAHRGEVHIPFLLTDNGPYADLLHRLTRLEDHDMRAAILTSIDLTEISNQHLVDTGPAFNKLEAVTDRIGEQVWWAENCHLFVGRLPPNPAMRRTPVR
jgi:hypothetical protein